jgi:formylglycine-generating enzyme required for sulfatase activity
VNGRLLVSYGGNVRVAHEALLRRWERARDSLRKLAEAELRKARLQRALAIAASVVFLAVAGVIGVSVYWLAGGLPFEAVPERWAYILGRELPVPALVEVPAGALKMGSERSPDEQPVHPVVFGQPVYFGKTEITFREWDACVADGGCKYRPPDQNWGRGTQPVSNVSWEDIQAYVAWLSRKRGTICRLPSEAEWEYTLLAPGP